MGKVLIVFTTRSGATKAIADLIAEGVRFSGAEAKVVNASKLENETDLQGYDAYIFGSATYHGEMLPAMKTILFLTEKAGLDGKVGGAFGAFGWSGEAPERIYETMKNVFNMNMVSDSLRLKSAAIEGGKKMAQDYGRQVGEKA